MNMTNWEHFAKCYSNYIDDVVLLSPLMAAKAYVAFLAQSSFNRNFQAIDLIFYDKFSNLSAAYSKILKLF